MAFANAPIAVTPNGSHWLWSWVFAIPQKAKAPEAAEKFALWATSKDYIKLVADDAGWQPCRPARALRPTKTPTIKKRPPLPQ